MPDALAMLRSPATAAGFVLPLRFMLVSSVSFVGLQLYWFSLFVRISLAQQAREKRKASTVTAAGSRPQTAPPPGHSVSFAEFQRMFPKRHVGMDEWKVFNARDDPLNLTLLSAAVAYRGAELLSMTYKEPHHRYSINTFICRCRAGVSLPLRARTHLHARTLQNAHVRA